MSTLQNSADPWPALYKLTRELQARYPNVNPEEWATWHHWFMAFRERYRDADGQIHEPEGFWADLLQALSLAPAELPVGGRPPERHSDE